MLLYPVFLTLIINHILTPEHKALFDNSAFELSLTTHKKFHTRLSTIIKFSNIHVVITPYMSNYINLPIIQAPPVQPQSPPVDQSTQAGTSTPLQVLPPLLASGAGEPQEGDRADQGVVEPQPLTQVIEPNTYSHISLHYTHQTKTPYQKVKE